MAMAAPEAVDLRRDLADLVSLAARPDQERELMRRGLDWLLRVAPHDLATLVVPEGDGLRGPLAPPPPVRPGGRRAPPPARARPRPGGAGGEPHHRADALPLDPGGARDA